jgi:hypothetical protein
VFVSPAIFSDVHKCRCIVDEVAAHFEWQAASAYKKVRHHDLLTLASQSSTRFLEQFRAFSGHLPFSLPPDTLSSFTHHAATDRLLRDMEDEHAMQKRFKALLQITALETGLRMRSPLSVKDQNRLKVTIARIVNGGTLPDVRTMAKPTADWAEFVEQTIQTALR